MQILKVLKNQQTTSFEFFPPKDDSQEQILFNTVADLKHYKPHFVSITYGAGGSTRDKTFEWSKTLTSDFNVMMHLTCYGNDADSIDSTCKDITEAGILNVLALRGDPPKDSRNYSLQAFDYASGMVKYIKTNFPHLCVAVAGYPETHPAAPSPEQDIIHLKEKADNGADFIITQLFFDNSHFFRFKELLARQHITIPVIAGIMPVANYSQVMRFTQMCGTKLPDTLIKRLEAATDEDAPKIGEEHAVMQSEELLKAGVDGIHYYTLNKSPSVRNIISALNQKSNII